MAFPFLFFIDILFIFFLQEMFSGRENFKTNIYFFFTKKQITLIVWAKRDGPEFARAIIFVIETQIARRAIVV